MEMSNFIWQDRERFHSLILGQDQKDYCQIIISLEKSQGNLELIEYYKGREFYHRRQIEGTESLQRILNAQLEQGRLQGLDYQVINLQERGNLDQQLQFLVQYLEELNGS